MNKQMDKSKLVDLCGDHPTVRVIDFLLGNPEKGYTLNQIMEETQSDNPSVYNFINKLVCKGYVLQNGTEYRVNLENSRIKQLLEIDWGNNHDPSCT